jgi:ZIP family zinc transporter
VGITVFAEHPRELGVLMLASAGGILYLTFQDIAPQAKLDNAWAPSLGAVAGFALGLLGHLLLT